MRKPVSALEDDGHERLFPAKPYAPKTLTTDGDKFKSAANPTEQSYKESSVAKAQSNKQSLTVMEKPEKSASRLLESD